MNDPAATGRLPRRPRSPLSYPAFRALWIAATVSWIGSFVQDVAERWLMLDLADSPLPVAMLSTVFVTASLVGLLPSGVLADRIDRRTLVVASQIAQALVSLSLAIMTWTGHVSPTLLLVAAAVAGLGLAIGQPAWAALVPEMVEGENVADAIAMNSVAFNLARALGPALGGAVLSAFGSAAAFGINAVTFLAVIGAVVSHRAPSKARERRDGLHIAPAPVHEPVLRAFAEPVRRAVGDAELRAAFGAMLAFTAGCSVVYALAPAYGKTTIGATPEQFGVMLGAMGAGAVLGATTLRRARERLAPRVLVAGTMLVYAASSLLLARAHSVAAAVVFFVPAGVGWLGTFSSLQAIVQLWTPDRLRARVIALYTMAHFAVWAVGASVGGAIAARWDVRVAMNVGAVVCVGAALVTARSSLPRSFEPPAM